MTILGFSDAKLAVVKRGPEEVREQGLLCDHIGSQVCPRVYRFLSDGYEMEILSPPVARSNYTLFHVVEKLRDHVWKRPSYQGWNRGWLTPLIMWSTADAPWLTAMINITYPKEPLDGYCLIHGDPTLANVMRRDNELIITDPMPRMHYRMEIPNRLEVDLGKLLQSAMGWERILGCESSLWNQPELVLGIFRDKLVKETLLWGAIHTARVAKRARSKGRSVIAKWAEETSRDLGQRLAGIF